MAIDMRVLSNTARTLAVIACLLPSLRAQELAPRAYLATPLRSNAVVLTYSFFNGDLQLNGTVPVNNAKGAYSVPVLSYYHTFGLFGRSSNITGSIPYAVGTFQADLSSGQVQVYRSGLADSEYRLSVNVFGAPAMHVRDFIRWKQKTLLGISLTVAAPTGQYDSTKAVNWGSNRWSIKPELGYSRRRGNWVVDAYTGVWFYSTNQHSFSLPNSVPQSEAPVESVETHLSYDLKPRLWISVDGNCWFGGVSTLNGIANPGTRQTSSRIGVTASMPLGKHQSAKVSYSDDAVSSFGAKYQNLSVALQYSWIGWKK
jgi:hypothetical protein